jgi:hypothetical protein
VTDRLERLQWCLATLAARFKVLLFVPGNHELWVSREARVKDSLQKFEEVSAVAESAGAWLTVYRGPGATIVPLLGWYDYSFGEPSAELKAVWMDFRACRWPSGMGPSEATAHFVALNEHEPPARPGTVITFSHFLPRIDIMPGYIPAQQRLLYPVLGTTHLETQLRKLKSDIHVYGHSHVNRSIRIDGVSYINNALGYPHEEATAKQLLSVHEC